jgi:hypothetical protein
VNESSPEPGVVRTEIVRPDGRLLWFYTFDDEPGDHDARDDVVAGKPA